ncbi:SusC/RagA family TonB-linked outer membrane protein [Chitinophaga qingshengii]|uniref:SusC/RagA family TonB-linked outer membrane protein n=1 Tax=Chitinophaga qingshengii TaxID=1569794 RepID=A0ABR7TT22_9BACT|nr:SusC/RagA family TonB-linked outer membrane protein [Chitinophaga qingshengii]MBC9933587.1 SusC/RagA family TonB-linked outer membrane protein [Chitinophaga qingshengii]
MKKKFTKYLKRPLGLATVLLLSGHLYAQQPIHFKGRVESFDKGEPIPGAAIMAGGKLVGITDVNGAFDIKDLTPGVELYISMMGYEKKQLVFDGASLNLQVRLKTATGKLNEVVITALNIKRPEKSLGYAQQTLNEESMTDARPNNWSDALRGKVAGLNIASLGGPLNSQEIRLRGTNSLTTNGNAALVVVDGVPVNGSLTTSGASNGYMGGDASIDVPVDFGNGIADINPDDIASVTILKGPGATALYGSRAANGAVLITTKSGAKAKRGLGVSFNSNTSFDVITRWPDWQYEYGQGDGKTNYNANGELFYSYGASADGRSTSGSSSAFGPKFDGQYYFQYDPNKMGAGAERTLWQPYKDNRKSFWQTGRTTTNSLSVENSGQDGSVRASVTHSSNKWIMPTTGFERITAAVNAAYKVSDRIRVSSAINYTNKSSDNLPGLGYNNHSIAYFMIFQNPNVDLDWYRAKWKPGQEGISMIRPYSSFIDNPFVIAEDITNGLRSNAITGNLKADIQLATKLTLMLRGGINTNHQARDQRRPYDTNRFGQGFYNKQNMYTQEINTDFLLSYKNAWMNDQFTLTASAGGNTMSNRYDRTDNTLIGLVVPGVYKMTNGVSNPLVATYDSRKRVNSLYGFVNLGYKEKIFLDLTGRNDWSSTLPEANWSFFYPSANLSMIISEMVKMPKAISYLKYRLSLAQVGNDTDPGRTAKYYNRSPFPSSAEAPSELYNLEFKPEISTSLETGIEVAFLKNRLKLDASVYRTRTKNQILSVPLERSTGFSSALLNSGEVRNQGLELILNATPVTNKNFTWNTVITWAATRSKVLSLDPRLGGKLTIMGSSSATLTAVEGETASALYGLKFQRTPDGQIIYVNGIPSVTQVTEYVGDTNPEWRAGWTNSLTYKGFRLSTTIDGQLGGILYSHSHHKMTEQGKLRHTLKGREEGWIVGEGVMQNADGSYSPNTVKVRPADYYAQYYRLNNTEANSFDASFMKLREVSLEYTFPKAWFGRTKIQNLSLAIYGRNLATLSDFPIYDPEVATQAGGTGILTGVEVGQLPTPSTFGFNLKVKL